jgi:hypothetical protein
MRQTLRGFLGLVILVALAANGQAQFGAEGRYRPEAVAAIIDHVHDDLSRGYTVWRLRKGDRERLTHAERQLFGISPATGSTANSTGAIWTEPSRLFSA